MKKLSLLFIVITALAMQEPLKIEINKANLWHRVWFTFFNSKMANEFVFDKHTQELYKIITITYHWNHYKRAKKSKKFDSVENLKLENMHVIFVRPIQDNKFTHEETDLFEFRAPSYILQSKKGPLYIDLEKLKGFDPDKVEDMFSCYFDTRTINKTLPIKPIVKMSMLIAKVSVKEIERDI